MISKNLFSKQEYSRLPLSSRRARSNGTIRCNNCNGNTYNYSRHNETGRPQRFFSSSNSQGNDKSPINVARQHVSMKSFAIGSVAGVMGSLAGMGGGFVMIPLMTSKLLQLSQHTAHGTSLFAVAATGIAGALGYGLKDTVEVDSAAAVACCGMMTASLGARQTSRMSGVILRKALGVFMLCVAFVVPARGYIADRYGNPKSCNGEGAGIDEGTKNDDNPPTGGTLQSIFMQSKEQSELVYSQEESETIFQKAVRNASFQRLFPSAVIGLTSGFMAGMFGVGGGAVSLARLFIVGVSSICY